MFYRKSNNPKDILKGLQIDDPKILIPWDINEDDFVDMFKNHNVARNSEKYCGIKNITVFGEINCNIVVEFDKTICKFSVSRNYPERYVFEDDYLIKSFNAFQIAIEKAFGKPTKKSKDETNFKNCEWDIGNKIKIYHFVMDRFGLGEYLRIEKI